MSFMVWSFHDADRALEDLLNLEKLLPFLTLLPNNAEISIFDAIVLQSKVIGVWTVPILVLTVLSVGVGVGLMWNKAKKIKDEREFREQGRGLYRGVTITLGELPEPKKLKQTKLELGSEDESLSKFSPEELTLLEQILGTIAAHPKAYAGDGISSTLFEHAINVTNEALKASSNPTLAAIAAAAYEMGKINAYKEKDGEWVLGNKPVEREGARMLGALPGWWELTPIPRMAVYLAVKYKHKSREIPECGGKEVWRLAVDILERAKKADVVIQEEAKQATIEAQDVPIGDQIYNALMRMLPVISFQTPGQPPGVPAFGWKFGKRVYLLEIKLREALLKELSPEVKGALIPNKSKRVKIQPVTRELLEVLSKRGWVIKQIGDVKLDLYEALWNIKAGNLNFKGIIILDLPDDILPLLPSGNSKYEINVLGPLFATPGTHSLGGNDLNGILGNNTAKAKPTEAKSAEEAPAPMKELDSTTSPQTSPVNTGASANP